MYQACETADMACKILIVDDSETDRATYRRYLERSQVFGCSIMEGDCGEAGLEIFAEHQPDVVLLDYLLPDLDGLEFLQSMPVAQAAMPAVIMLTGQGNEQVAVEAMKRGAQDYLIKGKLTLEQLEQTIRRSLTQRLLQQQLVRQQQQQRLLAEVALQISQLQSLESILQVTVEGGRTLLECDRTVIYRFESDMSGTIVAESVLPNWSTSLGTNIKDTCFQQQGVKKYLQGHKTVISDVHDSHLTPCHIKLLERFQVKANIVTPILLSDMATPNQQELWGLLIAHNCRAPKEWQASDLALLDDLTVQVAIAIQKSELLSNLEERASRLAVINDTLLKTTETLEIRNRELDEFAYVASHDLKAPLRAIANLANWVEEDLEGQLPEENRQQLALMQSRIQRMEGFINGLLQYSRAGRQNLDIITVDTHELICEICSSLVLAPEFRITLPESMPVVQTQKILLQQVLANLIGNAVKYHDRADGEVKITAASRAHMIEFAITDDGPGIAPEFHDRIFKVFHTLQSRDSVESTGIGLSIVKKLVEQQGGQASVRSAIGEGSTFTFTWPQVSSSETLSPLNL